MRFHHHIENAEGRTKVVLSLDEYNHTFNMKLYYNHKNTGEFGLNISGDIGNYRTTARTKNENSKSNEVNKIDNEKEIVTYYYLIPIIIFDVGNRVEIVAETKFDFELMVLNKSETLHIRDPIRDLISEDGNCFNNDDLTFSAVLFNNLNNDEFQKESACLDKFMNLCIDDNHGNFHIDNIKSNDKIKVLHSVTRMLKLEKL